MTEMQTDSVYTLAEVSLCSGVEINSDYGISAISKVIQKLHTTKLQLPKVALAQ